VQNIASSNTSSRAAAPAMDLASLSAVQRWSGALVELVKAIADLEDTQQVIKFLNLSNSGPSIRKRVEQFFSDPAGRKLYEARRAIDSRTVDLDALAALPEGTLGRAYATFLRSRGLTPAAFDGAPKGITDSRQSYLFQRLRQTHDLWHVATGCSTDFIGEIALQAFTFAQLRAPGNGILAVTAALRTAHLHRGIVRRMLELYRAGRHANRLPTFPWEDHWTTPLAEVRAMLGLPIAPRRDAVAAA
jgi:ubiquinone biosynthesis protein COQ4